MMSKNNKVLLLLGIAVVAIVRTLFRKSSEQKSSTLRERVNTWENEGGQVPGVPPTRT